MTDRLRSHPRAPLAAAAIAGAACALGQAPWGWWWLSVPALAAVLALLAGAPHARGAFLRGWLAGAASFMAAMAWIVEPFLIDPWTHGWLAPFALVLLPGGLALFWGAAAAFAAWAAQGWTARLALLVPALLAGEALRGHVLTGFPWAMLGHVWIDTPAGQIAAWTGALGLGLLTLSLAALLALAGRKATTRPGLAALAALLATALLAGAWSVGAARLAGPAPEPRDLRLRLVQPNAAQDLKWDAEHARRFFFRHLDLTAAPADDGRAPDLVLWSETAVPFLLDRPGDGLLMAAEAAGGAPLLLGIQRSEVSAGGGVDYFNSLAVLDAEGQPVAVYNKHHLVPFGEYVPVLGRFADRPGMGWLSGLASQVLLGYSAGPGPVLLDLGAAGRVLPLICYEAIFPANLRGTDRPDWIVQITNDAWFGARVGPFQHLAQARLRAIEQGLPLVRAANTGVSAVIDARGRIVASLGMGRAGTVDADLPGALPETTYARIGDAPWHAALALIVLAAGGSRLRRRGH
nr:apolipoprotein N-acyltransferase [Pararhodobacter sp. SW119]